MDQNVGGQTVRIRVTFDGGEFRVYDAVRFPGERSAGGVVAPWFTFKEMQRIAEDWQRVGVDDVTLRVEEDAEGWRTVAICDNAPRESFRDLDMVDVDGETFYALHGFAWVEVSDDADLQSLMDAFDDSTEGTRAGEEARSQFPRGSVWWDVQPGDEPDREDQNAAVEFLTAAFALWAQKNISEDRRDAAVEYYREQTFHTTEA